MPDDRAGVGQYFHDPDTNRTLHGAAAWAARKNALLGHLFQCFYCMSHWVVIAGMLVYRPALLHSDIGPIDWVMTAFIVLTVTTFINGLLFKVFQAAVRTHVMKHEAQQMLNSHEQ